MTFKKLLNNKKNYAPDSDFFILELAKIKKEAMNKVCICMIFKIIYCIVGILINIKKETKIT